MGFKIGFYVPGSYEWTGKRGYAGQSGAEARKKGTR